MLGSAWSFMGGFRLGAEVLDLFEGAELGEAVEGGLDDRLGVVGPHGLREDVLVTGDLEDGADAAAGDDAGSRRGWTEQHASATGFAGNFMRDGVFLNRDLDHALFGSVGGLADGFADLIGLAETETDLAFFITGNDQGAEAETATAFDHLGTTIDENHFFGDFLGLPRRLRARLSFFSIRFRRHGVVLRIGIRLRGRRRPRP